MTKPLRIFYAAGPGDVAGTYGHWKAGRDDPSQVSITYSAQFYSLCKELGAQGYVLSYNERRQHIVDGPFTIEHRPARYLKQRGALYHLGQFWAGIRMGISALRFGADLVVFSGGASWFSLGWLRWFGVKIVPTLHCVLWPKSEPMPRGVKNLVWKLNARFFRTSIAGVLSLSNDITHQLAELTRSVQKPIESFLPSYRRESFAGLDGAPLPPPFRVFFAGRIERNKGVFNLLEIARRFAREGRSDIEFDLCGDGSALPELRKEAQEAGLQSRFRCHGHQDKPRMREMYSQTHVVIVPTTTDFIEGFNKVVAEGILAGKPVITSSVCPALEYVADGIVEVPPNDTQAYGTAIIRLHEDRSLYESKRRGCTALQEQFYDPDRGWAAALKRMLDRLFDESPTKSASRNFMAESLPGRRMP